jgi:hypothetical protein
LIILYKYVGWVERSEAQQQTQQQTYQDVFDLLLGFAALNPTYAPSP